jgi:hypothetical protein
VMPSVRIRTRRSRRVILQAVVTRRTPIADGLQSATSQPCLARRLGIGCFGSVERRPLFRRGWQRAMFACNTLRRQSVQRYFIQPRVEAFRSSRDTGAIFREESIEETNFGAFIFHDLDPTVSNRAPVCET